RRSRPSSAPAGPCCGTRPSTARCRPSSRRPRCPSSPTSTRPRRPEPSFMTGPEAPAARGGGHGEEDADTVVAAMPEVVDQVALARLYGEPLFALPQDLYIP